MKDKYYLGKKCEVLAELPTGEVVIQLITGVYEVRGDHDEPPYSDVDTTTIVVNKEHIKDEPLTIEEEYRNKMEEAKKNIDAYTSNARKIISDEQNEWAQKKAEFEKLLKNINNVKNLETYAGIITGEYKYITIRSYGYYNNESRMNNFGWEYGLADDLMKDSEKKLRAVIYQQDTYGHKENEVDILLNCFSDGSGNSNSEVKLFRTEEELRDFINKEIDECNEFYSLQVVEKLIKDGYVNIKLTNYINKINDKDKEYKLIQIKKLEDELEKLKEDIK